MLKLTVLLRYSEEGRRVCKFIGRIKIDFKSRVIIGEETTDLFNKKYADKKSIICNLFTTKKSFQEISKEIEKNNMRMAQPRFPDDDKHIAILIED